MKRNFKKIIIIGYGNHTKYKIIPALEKTNIEVLGILSSKLNKTDSYYYFKNLKTLFKKFPHNEDLVVFLSNPPNVHYKYIKNLVLRKYNVICEKPIFIYNYQFDKIFLKIRNNLLIENLMYKHTLIYNELLNFWNKNKSSISEIQINFKIPDYPKNTFRNNSSVFNSYIYDIGCYPISLLDSLNLSILNFNKNELKINYFKKNHHCNFLFIKKNLCVKISIGIDNKYLNNVIIKYSKNKKIIFDYFFYGVSKNKTIKKYIGKKLINKKNIKDVNGFIALFNQDIKYWKKTQLNRFLSIKHVLFGLHKLSKLYKKNK